MSTPEPEAHQVREVPWLTIARDLVGIKEIKGAQHEPKILSLWKDAGLPFTDDETAWCAGFVGGVLKRAGVKPTGSAMARSYCAWGMDVSFNGLEEIPLGAILVFSRPPSETAGHTNFAVGRTPEGHIVGLGGNQRDSVSIAPFEFGRLIAARWPIESQADLRQLRKLPVMSSTGALSTKEM